MINSEISAKRLLDALVYGVLENATTAVIDGSYYEQISELVEADTFDAQSPLQLAELAFCSTSSRLLDFGCGTGTYRDVLSNMGYSWSGVNYRQGMALEAAYQASSDPAINFYDGVVLPFESEYFDVILSLQTFEHIQHIDATFGEIRRVLVRGGKLVGSVSYLEQIHDYSTFNFTPLGFRMAMERNGLVVKKLFPQNDVFSFLLHRLCVVSSASDETSLVGNLGPGSSTHMAIIAAGKRLGISTTRINLLRLMFCSNFSFLVEKS